MENTQAVHVKENTPAHLPDWSEVQSTKEELQFIAEVPAEDTASVETETLQEAEEVKQTEPKHAQKHKHKKAKAASPESLERLKNKFSKDNSKVRNPVPALLVPSNRPASSYLSKAFAGKFTPKQSDGEDGVDHINVSQMGTTTLGKFLDINAKAPFNHPELSHFQSVGGLWFFVKTQDHSENFRYVWGDRCRKMGKECKTIEVEGFKTIIADATWIKIISNQEMVDEMILSELPFKNYFYYGALKIKKTTPESAWYCRVLEEIRVTLKKRVEINDPTLQPDFSFLDQI